MNSQGQESLRVQMSELIATLQKWDYEYYILNNPSVDDAVYDQKMYDLKELEIQSSVVLPNSPTRKLNKKIYKHSQFKLVKRAVPMLSIDNTNNKEGLLAFDRRVRRELGVVPEYLCELKIDGLSASVLYENYKLVQISTRGDGLLGEDVTFNQEVISNLPLQLTSGESCEVRGEVYMRKEEFLTLNEEISQRGMKKLANARNATAGTLRTLVPNKERKLRFFAYHYFLEGLMTQEQCLKKLTEDGFEVGEHRLCRSIEEAIIYTEEVAKRRDGIGFAVDGVVVKVNQYSFHKKLGETSKFPRWAIAYKFTPLSATSVVRAINRAVSKNGRITYVALVDKVTIAGSSIGSVTLHNFAFIKKKMLNIGDEVLINKAGDVIPQVAAIVKNSNEGFWGAPSYCPSCSSELTWETSYLYQLCTNGQCTEKNINYLVFFASKSAIDIRGVSKSIVERLFQLKLVRRPYDFYSLDSKHDQLNKIEMFKEKSITNLLNAIDRSRYKSFASFVTAFSIPLLSSVKAQKLAMIFNENIEEFLVFIREGNFTFLKTELGVKTGESIMNFFQDSNNLENFERTSLQMIFIKP